MTDGERVIGDGPRDQPVFRMGRGGAEFRHSDANGRPVDVSGEGDTARSERIYRLQDRWQPRRPPSADPGDVLAEWMAQDPANRMSPFARSLAEFPERLPAVELEPGPGEQPVPGGILDRMARTRRNRGSAY